VGAEIGVHLPVGRIFFPEYALQQFGGGFEQDRFGHENEVNRQDASKIFLNGFCRRVDESVNIAVITTNANSEIFNFNDFFPGAPAAKAYFP
jgi:hypothetical protein